MRNCKQSKQIYQTLLADRGTPLCQWPLSHWPPGKEDLQEEQDKQHGHALYPPHIQQMPGIIIIKEAQHLPEIMQLCVQFGLKLSKSYIFFSIYLILDNFNPNLTQNFVISGKDWISSYLQTFLEKFNISRYVKKHFFKHLKVKAFSRSIYRCG